MNRIIFNDILPTYSDFSTKIIPGIQMINPILEPVIGWEKLYNLIFERFNDQVINTTETEFVRDFKNQLLDILPRYNKQWVIALSEQFKDYTYDDLLQVGYANSNQDETNTASNPDYINDGIADDDYLSQFIKSKSNGKNLSLNIVYNIKRWVREKMNLTGIQKLLNELLELFSYDFDVYDDDPNFGFDTDTNHVEDESLYKGYTLTDTLNKIKVDIAQKGWNYDAEGNKIINLKDGTDPQDAVTKKQLDEKPSKWNYDAEGNKIINVADPTENQDTVTKAYFEWNTQELREQVDNLDTNGEIVDDTYDPVLHPKRFVSQRVLKDELPIESYKSQNFQQFKSNSYPSGRLDDTWNTINGWVESSVKSKTIFTTQSNGAFVIDEEYRKEIATSGKDRLIKVEFKFDGFITYKPNYIARFDVAGAYDFGGDKNIVNRTQTGGSSYLAAASHSVHSTVFRIPHGISTGDLMWLEIKTADISQADMRNPYFISFTELGNSGTKGEKGDPGTSTPVREVMYNETQEINNNGNKNFNILPTGVNKDFKNIKVIIDTKNQDLNINYFIYDLKDSPTFNISKYNPPAPTYNISLGINPTANYVRIYNSSGSNRDFTLYITGERITTTRKVKK